jgi:hypothetical protein
LRAQQALTRYRSPVETWLDQFEPGHVEKALWADSTVRAKDLYAVYREYEESYHPGIRTGVTEWGSEMTRLIENRVNAPVFEKYRTSRGNCYRYVGAQPPASVMSKVVSMSGAAVR